MSDDEGRRRVAGSFVDPDEEAAPLLVAIGRAIWGVAALEHGMRLELAGLLTQGATETPLAPDPARARAKLDKEPAKLRRMTGGELLWELRTLGLPSSLDKRIGDAVDRHNALVHHAIEEPDLLAAALTGESMDAVVTRVGRLALDCGELAVELIAFGVAKLEKMTGKPRDQLVADVLALPPSEVHDPAERVPLERFKSLGLDPRSVLPSELL